METQPHSRSSGNASLTVLQASPVTAFAGVVLRTHSRIQFTPNAMVQYTNSFIYFALLLDPQAHAFIPLYR